jgi:hypothetical protein
MAKGAQGHADALGHLIGYRAASADCRSCLPKPRGCGKELAWKIPRSVYEAARNVARAFSVTSRAALSAHRRSQLHV